MEKFPNRMPVFNSDYFNNTIIVFWITDQLLLLLKFAPEVFPDVGMTNNDLLSCSSLPSDDGILKERDSCLFSPKRLDNSLKSTPQVWATTFSEIP